MARTVIEVATPAGPARLHVDDPDGDGPPSGVLVLGHGAGGGVGAPDLLAAVSAAFFRAGAPVCLDSPSACAL